MDISHRQRRFVRDIFRKHAPQECANIPYHLSSFKTPEACARHLIKKYNVKQHEIPEDISTWLGIEKKQRKPRTRSNSTSSGRNGARQKRTSSVPQPTNVPRIRRKSNNAESCPLRQKITVPEPNSNGKKKSKKNHVQKKSEFRSKKPAHIPLPKASVLPQRIQREEGNYNKVMHTFSEGMRLEPKMKPRSKNVKNVDQLNKRVRSTPIRAEIFRERMFVREPGAAIDFGELPEFSSTPYGDSDDEPKIPEKAEDFFSVGEAPSFNLVQNQSRSSSQSDQSRSEGCVAAKPKRPKPFRPKAFNPFENGFTTQSSTTFDAESILRETRMKRRTLIRESGI